MKPISYFLLFGISAVSSLKTTAQLMTNDNVSITITGGAQLTVKGDIQNQNSTTFNNSGTIDLSGNWIHNSANTCFGTSAGTVIFNGAAQSIGGTNPTVFNNLNLTGSGLKTLNQDITTGGANALPAGILNLSALNLVLNSKTLTISNPLPVAITRTTGFIISETNSLSGYGTIKWNIGNSISGNNYEFPFGNILASTYLPVNFVTTSAGTGNGSLSLSTYPTLTAATPNNRPLPTGVSNLLNIFGTENASKTIDRYWIMNTQGYTTNPTANLVLSYLDNEHDVSGSSTNTITESSLKAQNWDGTKWIQPQIGSINTVTNKMTLTGISSFNTAWTFTSTESPLPVELLDFKVQLNSTFQSEISWITASETNCDYFEVEKSDNGLQFTFFDRVKGAGNSNTTLHYHTTDVHPFIGKTYYRLKQVDFNGDYTYSAIRQVEYYKSDKQSLHIYPNPFAEQTTFRFNSNSKVVTGSILNLYNTTGQIVYSKPLSELNTTDGTAFTLKKGNLIPGFYQYTVQSVGRVEFTGKLIIQ